MAIWLLVITQMLRALTVKGLFKGLLVCIAAAYGWKFYLMHHNSGGADFNDMPTRGRVVSVADGDTLTILDPKQHTEHIRVANIDAPEIEHGPREPGQPYGQEARMFLDRFAYHKDVVLQCYERDQYGRAVCEVWIGQESAARELVRRGFAWANTARPEYMHDYNVLPLAAKAQAARLGLWATTEPPIAPWRWRALCWRAHQCTAPSMAADALPLPMKQ